MDCSTASDWPWTLAISQCLLVTVQESHLFSSVCLICSINSNLFIPFLGMLLLYIVFQNNFVDKNLQSHWLNLRYKKYLEVFFFSQYKQFRDEAFSKQLQWVISPNFVDRQACVNLNQNLHKMIISNQNKKA